jgi:DNA polymerase/3'-5' exonuclease PolX
MNHDQALRVAESLIDDLRPAFEGHIHHTEIITIAGSLRRGKKELDEIDLIGIPDLSPPPRPRAEFGKPVPKVYSTKIDQLIDELASRGEIAIKTNGPRSKKFFSVTYGIRVDLSLVRPPATWGVLYTIRTGPADFSNWIVTPRKYRGALPNGYRVQDGAVYLGEEKTKTVDDLEPIGFETEDSFLDFLGLGWIYPEDRAAKWRERSRHA